jgi:hypothetical protein
MCEIAEASVLSLSRSRSHSPSFTPFTADGVAGHGHQILSQIALLMGLRGERRVLVGSLVLASPRFTRTASTEAPCSAGQDRPGLAWFPAGR